MSEEINNKVPNEDDQDGNEEKIEKVTFENEEDYKKELSKASQSAKNDIMKELGITSIKEFQTNQNEYANWKKEQMSETEKANAEIESFKSKQTEWNNEKFNYQANITGLKLGVNDKHINKVITLAKAEINENENLTIDEAIKKVVNDIPAFQNIDENGKLNIKFGNDKGNTELTGAEKIKADTYKAFGLKQK